MDIRTELNKIETILEDSYQRLHGLAALLEGAGENDTRLTGIELQGIGRDLRNIATRIFWGDVDGGAVDLIQDLVKSLKQPGTAEAE